MKFHRIYALFLRQIYLLRYNRTRFSNIFLWVTLDILLWGFITRYLDRVGNTEFSFIPLLLGAIIFWDFMLRVQQGVMLAFFEDIWAKNFLNLFASPLKVKEYVAALVLTGIMTSIAGLILMLMLATLLFGFDIFALGGYAILFLFSLFVFGVALGVFASAVVLRLGPSGEWFAWPIPFVLAPFLGIYYPISVLPGAVQVLSYLLPPSYTFEGVRSLLFTGVFSLPHFLIGLGLGLLYLVLAYLFFVRIYRSILRSGVLVRYSAEINY